MKRACLVLAVLVMVSCDGDKPSPLVGPAPVTAILSSVLFQGPDPPTVGPGESARLKAIGRYSDGSEKDVSADATWTSSQTRIATVAAGVITGQALGRVTISARFESRTASLRVVIQPAGTFILSGNITEPGPINVGSATIAVGSNQVTSNTGGFYELFGVSGTVSVRAGKPGYFDETRALTVTENQRLDLQIRPVLAPTSIAGNYRVTLTISSACASIPAEHKTRTYTAAIEQSSARVRVQLRDANFGANSRGEAKNVFEGKVIGNTVTFEWGTGSNYYYYYDDLAILEVLSSTQTLGIWGRMEAQVAPTISGNLVGGFFLREGNRTSRCSDSNNTVVFTRN